MTKRDALSTIQPHLPVLRARFGVEDVALFGSVVRDEAGPRSDIDILVRFGRPATSERYFGVLFSLEDLLGCPIDLVTAKALRRELAARIREETVHV